MTNLENEHNTVKMADVFFIFVVAFSELRALFYNTQEFKTPCTFLNVIIEKFSVLTVVDTQKPNENVALCLSSKEG